MDSPLVSSSVEHNTSLLSYLASSYKKEENLDLSFVCKGGKVIKAHQLVLASVSPFLRKLFNEIPTPEVSISLSEIDDHILAKLLTLLYEGALKLLASDVQEFQELVEILGILIPGELLMNPSSSLYTDSSQNGIETSSSSTIAIVAVTSVAECISGPNDDPLNIPDRYFVKPKAGGSGQSIVAPVQPQPAARKASTSEKTGNRKLRVATTSAPTANLSKERRVSQTNASVPSRQTSRTIEGTSDPSSSNGPVHNSAKSAVPDSPQRLKKRKRSTESGGEKLARKKTRSKDKVSNQT